MKWIYPILGDQKRLPVYLSGIGIAEPEYHVCRNQGLVSHQFLYTQSGRGIVIVDGKRYHMEKESLFYLAPGVAHEYYPVEEGQWTTCWVVLRGEYLTQLLQNIGLERFAYGECVVTPEIRTIFSQLMVAAKDTLGGAQQCSVLLYEYILSVWRSLAEQGRDGRQAEKAKGLLKNAVQHMEEHYAKDISLEELAQKSGITKQHFCRVFREQMGMRPMEYLARLRIAAARELLLQTGSSVEEIGKQVGYDNPTYFGMVFKKYEGITPTECRRRRGTRSML